MKRLISDLLLLYCVVVIAVGFVLVILFTISVGVAVLALAAIAYLAYCKINDIEYAAPFLEDVCE